jgi:archaellum component FlaF (FlaF/FlaG flagellin family)
MAYSRKKFSISGPWVILIVGLFVFGGLFYGNSKTKTVVEMNNKKYECRGIPNKINALCISCLDWDTNQSLIICSETTNGYNSPAFPIESADIQ